MLSSSNCIAAYSAHQTRSAGNTCPPFPTAALSRWPSARKYFPHPTDEITVNFPEFFTKIKLQVPPRGDWLDVQSFISCLSFHVSLCPSPTGVSWDHLPNKHFALKPASVGSCESQATTLLVAQVYVARFLLPTTAPVTREVHLHSVQLWASGFGVGGKKARTWHAFTFFDISQYSLQHFASKSVLRAKYSILFFNT